MVWSCERCAFRHLFLCKKTRAALHMRKLIYHKTVLVCIGWRMCRAALAVYMEWDTGTHTSRTLIPKCMTPVSVITNFDGHKVLNLVWDAAVSYSHSNNSHLCLEKFVQFNYSFRINIIGLQNTIPFLEWSKLTVWIFRSEAQFLIQKTVKIDWKWKTTLR